jgi:hypothetical protein
MLMDPIKFAGTSECKAIASFVESTPLAALVTKLSIVLESLDIIIQMISSLKILKKEVMP